MALGAVASLAVALNIDGDVDGADAWTAARAFAIASYVVVGVAFWTLRPRARLGRRMALLGLFYALAALTASDDASWHTAGRVALAVFVVLLGYLFLCFPHDSLPAAFERKVFAGLALTTAVAWLIALPTADTLPAPGPLADCTPHCPGNALQVVTARPVSWSSGLVTVVTAAWTIVIAFALWRRARSTPLRRRLIAPVLYAALVQAAAYAAYTLLREHGSDWARPVRMLGAAAAIAVPWSMLIGQFRGRVFAATRLGSVVERTGGEAVSAAHVQTLLRDLLGDPTLALALSTSGGASYVDVHGRAMGLPEARGEVAVTPMSRVGVPVAVLVHDAALDDLGLTPWVAATALMLLQNAELVDELRESRARIVAAAQAERLRLERNLHDGAQQRLLAVQIKLRAARTRRGRDREHALEDLELDVETIGRELVELAHGLYPTVLRERGLGDALRASARNAALPVSVVVRGIGRLAGPVEEAVYFCALEAVQNAAKHAGPGTHVGVTLERTASGLEFAIADDGNGFVPGTSPNGLGMTSMRDRIGAVGGELIVVSEPGRGTIVRGVIPLST